MKGLLSFALAGAVLATSTAPAAAAEPLATA